MRFCWVETRTFVDKRGDDLRFGPFHLLVILLRQAIPAAFVCNADLLKVVGSKRFMEVDDKLKQTARKS